MLTNEDIVANLSAELAKLRRNNNPTGRHIVFGGLLVGRPDGYLFDPNAPHTYCRLCGAVFQTQGDRESVSNYAIRVACTLRRKQWSHEHAATHSLTEHNYLAASGRYMTPEAAANLIPLGIIPVSDMIFDPATEQAANEAPRLNTTIQDRMEEQRDAVL